MSAALQRFVELYTTSRGGDPYIGPRLPSLLAGAGLERIDMKVVQPAGLEGEVKLLNPITMQNIADAVLAEGLAELDEVEKVAEELYELARDTQTFMSLPRVIQAWGRRRAA